MGIVPLLVIVALATDAAAQTLPCACTSVINYDPSASYTFMCIKDLGGACRPKYGSTCDSFETQCLFNAALVSPPPAAVGGATISPPPPPSTTCVDQAGKEAKCVKASASKCAKNKFVEKCCGTCGASYPTAATAQATSTACVDQKSASKCAQKASKCSKARIQQKCRYSCNVGGCATSTATGR